MEGAVSPTPVTGVSRSGRVRKKSSKLADFESPDDIEKRRAARNPDDDQLVTVDQLPPENLLDDGQIKLEDEEDFDIEDVDAIDIKEEDFDNIPDIDDEEDALNEDDDEGTLMIDDSKGRGKKKELGVNQAQSLYFSEKAAKKNMVWQEGQLVRKTKVRKDKGKTRITAYMLWAKTVREEILLQNPGMDFAAVSKRLGELWGTVSNAEKYNWKRRAKRLATKGLKAQAAADKVKPKPPTKTTPATMSKPPPRPLPINNADPPVVHPVYKVVGSEPLDVAAHLKLLGESLSVIGERLTEHEGQIAVSGSLSVLLDSLLCAMGPLICLTQQVPELNAIPQDQLGKILDNVAYIMPGL